MEKNKNKFVDITSHELRTPVSNILTFTELLQERAAEVLQGDGQQFLSVIADNAARLKLIVDDMHSSLFETDLKDRLNVELFGVQDFINELVHEFEETAKKRSLKLSVKLAKKPREWQGDRLKLQRGVRELIENAIKFTPDGRRIEILCDLAKDKLRIQVIDEGIGISDKEKFKIFDKFYESQESQYHSTSDSDFMGAGTGLGLAAAKSIVEAHGGRITVDSTVDKGSSFTIKIPMVPIAIKVARPDTTGLS